MSDYPEGPPFTEQIDQILAEPQQENSPYSAEYLLGQNDLLRQMKDEYLRMFLTRRSDGSFGVQFSPLTVLHEHQSLELILSDFDDLGDDAAGLPAFLRKMADKIELAQKK